MKNYGTKKYAFIPANEKFFDFSLLLAKFFFFRILKKLRFNYKKSKQTNERARAKCFGFNNYDILLNCKYNGYKVLIYANKENHYSKKKLNSKLGFLVKLGLVEEIIENIDVDYFDDLMLKYSISTVNSIFITDDVEAWHKLYSKYHSDDNNKLNNCERHEFAIKHWNSVGFDSIYPNSFNNSHSLLYSLFYHQFRPVREIFSVKSADFVKNQVIYIDGDNDDNIKAFIEQNYDLLKEKFKEKDLAFIYFPKLKDDIEEYLKVIKPAFDYVFPQFRSHDFSFIKIFFESMTGEDYYSYIINTLQLPDFPKPSLLKNLYSINDSEENLFYYHPLTKDFREELMWYAKNTVKPNTSYEGNVYYQKPKIKIEYNADDNFDKEAQNISKEIKSKIDILVANGKHKALAEMVLHICSNLKNMKPELYEKIKLLNIAENKVKLSPVLIESNYRIFLPEYDNIEIVMSPLPKTLYLFFLKQPNGIMLHDLAEHKKELLAIYNKITNSSEPTEIIKRIDDMVDMTNNSINEKCSRIKEAFVSKIDDSLAKHYYVNGKRGAPKKVSLTSDLIIFK
jgi:hypothetical protein